MCPSWSMRDRLFQIRSDEMPVPKNYELILRRVALSPYKDALEWLELNAWQRVDDPISLDLAAFCHRTGLGRN